MPIYACSNLPIPRSWVFLAQLSMKRLPQECRRHNNSSSISTPRAYQFDYRKITFSVSDYAKRAPADLEIGAIISSNGDSYHFEMILFRGIAHVASRVFPRVTSPVTLSGEEVQVQATLQLCPSSREWEGALF